jgi:hypothetical protein
LAEEWSAQALNLGKLSVDFDLDLAVQALERLILSPGRSTICILKSPI